MTSQGSNLFYKQLKLKEQLLSFLNAKDLLTSVEQTCIYYCQRYASSKSQTCFDPLVVNLNLRFGDIEKG